ncbi:DUF4456 domain-containing protein [Caenorhabditis elegans]|uniref:DUF4456 domain-containing protein n=1 Tax=Caenorhabditis elegans TaxID=6239 RepID=Q18617_CAEEL|nr:DUF4456 domain-containing protein [Caenorhabditis elegans]CAA93639.2 DUF4456 domain-containing protein [Caenorhabditis elegans]
MIEESKQKVEKHTKMKELIQVEQGQFISLHLYRLFLNDLERKSLEKKLTKEQVKLTNIKASKQSQKVTKSDDPKAIAKQAPPAMFKVQGCSRLDGDSLSQENAEKPAIVIELENRLVQQRAQRRKIIANVTLQDLDIPAKEAGTFSYDVKPDYSSLPDELKKESNDAETVKMHLRTLEETIQATRNEWVAVNGAEYPDMSNILIRFHETDSFINIAKLRTTELEAEIEQVKASRRTHFNQRLAAVSSSVSRIYREISEDPDSTVSLASSNEDEPYEC